MLIVNLPFIWLTLPMTMSGCIVFLRWKKKTHLCCVLLFSHFLSVLACLAFILLLSLAKQTHHLGAHWKAEWRTSCNAAWKYLLYLKFIKCFTGFIVYTACYKRCRQSCASYRVRSTVALTNSTSSCFLCGCVEVKCDTPLSLHLQFSFYTLV